MATKDPFPLQLKVPLAVVAQLKHDATLHGRTLNEECIVRLSIAPPADMLAKPAPLVPAPYNTPLERMVEQQDATFGHDPKTCRNRFCGRCKAVKERKGTK